MTKKQNDEYEAREALQTHGWDVRKRDPTNDGSETARHMAVKGIVATVGNDLDYRIDFEVPNEDRTQFIDVLLYGNPDRVTYAVEAEHGVTETTISDKLKYVGGPINDILVIDLDQLPDSIEGCYEHVKGELMHE